MICSQLIFCHSTRYIQIYIFVQTTTKKSIEVTSAKTYKAKVQMSITLMQIDVFSLIDSLTIAFHF